MTIQGQSYINIFREIGYAFNSHLGNKETLRIIARTVVENLSLKGCHILLLSQDRKKLDFFVSYGLSQRFLRIFQNGSVDAEKSVTEALQGEIVFVEDTTRDPRIQYPEEHVKEGIVSLLVVPLKSRGQVIGSMRLSASEKRPFTPQEIDILRVVADFATSAAIHAMFHSIIDHVTQAVRSSLDLNELYQSIVRVITEQLRIKGCAIRMLDAKREKLVLKAAHGLSQAYLNKGPVDADKSVAEALDGECIVIKDMLTDPRIQYPEEARREEISSMLSVPLMSKQESIGILRVYTKDRYDFSENEIIMMKAIGEQCALAIRNAQLYTTMKERYEVLMADFHKWFDESNMKLT